jgi:hypothetical protein
MLGNVVRHSLTHGGALSRSLYLSPTLQHIRAMPKKRVEGTTHFYELSTVYFHIAHTIQVNLAWQERRARERERKNVVKMEIHSHKHGSFRKELLMKERKKEREKKVSVTFS